MVSCEICGKEFKNRAGLAGHQQNKHAPTAASIARCEQHQQQAQAAPLAAGEQQSEVSVAQLERIEVALGELLVSGEEFHQLEQQIKDAFTRGAREAVSTMVAIPGVSAAKNFNDWSKQHEVEHPGFPVVHSWEDVPGVKELIEKYQMDNSVFTLVTDAVPSSNYESILAGLFPG